MKLLLSFLLLFSPLLSYSANAEAVIIASYCYLYSAPSFSSEKVQVEEKNVILYHNDKVNVIQEDSDFILVTTNDEQKIQGWIYKYYLTDNSSQIVYPVFNGSVRNDNTIIYDINKEPTQYTASSGQRIFIYNGFGDQNDFTSVQLVLEDGSLYNGYLKSADISPDGISSLLIVGISIIAACVTIILSIVFIKKTKKKN